MDSNVMCETPEAIKATNGAYGIDAIPYQLFVFGVCNPLQIVEDGDNLNDCNYTKVNYVVAERFPEDQMVSALNATMTEYPQVHAVPNKFKYLKFTKGCELIISTKLPYDFSSVSAGVVNNMLMKYDFDMYQGDNINQGLINNKNGIYTESEEDLTDFEKLFDVISDAVYALKKATRITETQYSSVHLNYTEAIGKVLGKTQIGQLIPNRQLISNLFKNIVFVEIPDTVEKRDVLFVSYQSAIMLNRGKIPSAVKQEISDYDDKLKTKFGYQTTGIEITIKGALQLVSFRKRKSASKKASK